MANKRLSYQGDVNKIIVVDGIIGAGKTTLSHYLSQHYDLEFYEELEDDAQSSLTQEMLDLFYKDPCRWSGMTQVMFLSHRFRDLKDALRKDKPCLFDRSIYGDEIFAYNLFKRSEMSLNEYRIYQGLLQPLLRELGPPRLFIYLDVEVDTAMERIAKRSRSTEASQISRAYMEDLKRSYDLWFESFDLCEKIQLDFNEDGIRDDQLKLIDQALKGVAKRV